MCGRRVRGESGKKLKVGREKVVRIQNGRTIGDSRLRSPPNHGPQRQNTKQLSVTQSPLRNVFCGFSRSPLFVSLSPKPLTRWRSSTPRPTRKLETRPPGPWNLSRHFTRHSSKTNPNKTLVRIQPSSAPRGSWQGPGVPKRQGRPPARLCRQTAVCFWEAQTRAIE